MGRADVFGGPCRTTPPVRHPPPAPPSTSSPAPTTPSTPHPNPTKPSTTPSPKPPPPPPPGSANNCPPRPRSCVATVLGRQRLDHGWVPQGLLFAQGIAEDEQLAHAGGERHLRPMNGADGRRRHIRQALSREGGERICPCRSGPARCPADALEPPSARHPPTSSVGRRRPRLQPPTPMAARGGAGGAAGILGREAREHLRIHAKPGCCGAEVALGAGCHHHHAAPIVANNCTKHP